MKNFRLLLVFLIIGLFTGCLEHTYLFQVQPDGRYTVNYWGKGSLEDFQDSDYLPPFGNEWDIVHNFDELDADTQEYHAHAAFPHKAPFPKNFFSGDSIYSESLLNHDLEISSRNWWVKSTYEFSGKFPNRGVSEKYPLMGNLFNDEAADGWAAQYLSFLFTETLNRSPVSYNLQPIVRSEIAQWLADNVTGVPDTTLEQNFFELKRDGMDVLMRPLPSDLFPVLDSLFKLLDDEARVTTGLADDDFEFRIILPGELEETNADTLMGDTLVWHFRLADYMDSDYEMFATSKIVNSQRYRILLAVFAVGVIVLLGLGYRYRKA